MASAEDSQRASGSSAGRSSGSSRRQNVGTPQRGGGPIIQAGGLTNAPQPQQQLSTIEKSVTHLLVATKQLLETLTLWSRGSAAESEVSDVYVRLGYEFNIACRAFNAIGVDTTDLGPVPDLLRAILEDTLSQEANQASLDKYLPRIRDIIINLLHGLKKKQQRLRQRNGKDGADARPPRQSSTASNASIESNLTQQLEDVPSRASSHRSFAQRQGSNEFAGPELPPRTTSTQGRTSPRRQNNLSPPTSMHQQQLSRDTSDSTLSSNTMQNIPVIAPYPENDTMPTNQGFEQQQREQNSPEPPPPPPKQNDALQALQRGGELERRASRRFSAYQIQKHLGTSVNGIGTIPPAQNSPIPNRGRDARESMNAVRSRRSVLQHNRTKSRNDREGYEPSPSRLQHEVRRISETSESDPPQPPFAGKGEPDSPIVKTPEDKLGPAYPFPDLTKDQREGLGATVNGPVEDHFGPPGEMTPQELSTQPATPIAERKSIVRRTSSRLSHPPQRTPPQSQFIGESSPQPGKELTLFLQYKSKIKKFVLSDGADLTVPRLQLAFIEKFAWNTHNNGVDLPEIYIQDPVSGVRHEVEDLSDIKERSVLVLNVEQLDEVKRHIDDGIGGLRRMIEGVKTSVEDQHAAIQRISDRQQESAKEIANIAAAPPAAIVSQTPSATSSSVPSRTVSIKDKTGQLDEVQSLRRDLAVVRQTYTTFVDDIKANMATIRTKAASIGPAATKAAVPELDPNSGRAYVNNGKKTLSDDSEKIVNRVDDLQDTVEDLRKDVVTRGVRPIPRQLEDVSKDISTATADLRKLKEFLKREKPVWTKIWEKELQVVCDDRDLLTMQEELAADLEDDLEKAAATFALVEEATKQQNLANPRATDDPAKTVRSTSRTLRPFAEDQNADPQKAKDGVLGEVRALQPNHESRLEAIERAERARQRELESRRGGEFQKELGNFVEEGKLKKSGGVEEVERLRLVKEERARKENYERVAQRERDRAEREAAAAAAALAPPAEAEAAEAEGEAEAAEVEAAPEEASSNAPEGTAEDPVPVDSNDDPSPADAKTESGTDGAPSEEPAPPPPAA
jgi:archaellum component FlaC